MLAPIKEKSIAQKKVCREFLEETKAIVQEILHRMQLSSQEKELVLQEINGRCEKYYATTTQLEDVCLKKIEQQLQSEDVDEDKDNVSDDYYINYTQLDDDYVPSNQDDEEDEIMETRKHASSNAIKQKIKFQCGQCQKKLSSKIYLARHQLLHSKERPFSCSECSKKFVLPHRLHQHLFKVHKLNPWVCEQCHQRFRIKAELSAHVSSTHQTVS